MEQLGILEEKLKLLIESKKKDSERILILQRELEELKIKNSRLLGEIDQVANIKERLELVSRENIQLKSQVEKMENNLLTRRDDAEVFNQERELAKMAVEDLIKDIDEIIGSDQQ